MWLWMWHRLRDRHDDGTPHIWERSDEPLGWHWCEHYCYHYRVVCLLCGERRTDGHGVPELR